MSSSKPTRFRKKHQVERITPEKAADLRAQMKHIYLTDEQRAMFEAEIEARLIRPRINPPLPPSPEPTP